MTRAFRATAVVVAVTTLAGCGNGSSPSILDRAGNESDHVASLWWLMFGLAAAVYVLVAGLVLWAIARGRRRERGQAPKRGPSDGLFIWGGGLLMPVAVLAVLAVVTVTTTKDVRQPSSDELRIHVAGEQWWWDITYPDGGVRTANEIHVPVGRPVDIALSSDNVVHSFWVPQLAGKVDLIPGQTNHLRLTATSAGTYRGQCAEFCGLQHAHMAFVVIAESPQDFARWLARRSSGAGINPTDEQAAQGQRVFERESCAGCHTIKNTSAQGTVGPDLSDFGERRSIGALTVPNTPANLSRWITNSQSIKPGNLMPPIKLDSTELAEVVAYLEGLK